MTDWMQKYQPCYCVIAPVWEIYCCPELTVATNRRRVGNLAFQNFELNCFLWQRQRWVKTDVCYIKQAFFFNFYFHVSYHKIYITLDIRTAVKSSSSVFFTSVLCACLSSVLGDIDIVRPVIRSVKCFDVCWSSCRYPDPRSHLLNQPSLASL